MFSFRLAFSVLILLATSSCFFSPVQISLGASGPISLSIPSEAVAIASDISSIPLNPSPPGTISQSQSTLRNFVIVSGTIRETLKDKCRIYEVRNFNGVLAFEIKQGPPFEDFTYKKSLLINDGSFMLNGVPPGSLISVTGHRGEVLPREILVPGAVHGIFNAGEIMAINWLSSVPCQ